MDVGQLTLQLLAGMTILLRCAALNQLADVADHVIGHDFGWQVRIGLAVCVQNTVIRHMFQVNDRRAVQSLADRDRAPRGSVHHSLKQGFPSKRPGH
ncbi:hypothetical protein D3C81_1515070 [compost metagenome]